MTGLTHVLTEQQVAELRLYAGGEPVKRTPSTNLIRRNLVMSARQSSGVGFYRITGFGRDLLAERGMPPIAWPVLACLDVCGHFRSFPVDDAPEMQQLVHCFECHKSRHILAAVSIPDLLRLVGP